MTHLIIEKRIDEHFWQVYDIERNKIVLLANSYQEALKYVKDRMKLINKLEHV